MKNQNETPNQTPAQPQSHPGEAFCHLNRIMRRSSEEERQFFSKLLEDCAKTPLDLPEEVLFHASKALNMGLRTEGVEGFAEYYRDFSRLMVEESGWLWSFMRTILDCSRKQKLRPADVALMLSSEIDELDMRLENARELLNDSPELVADDIRKAVEAQPELLRA